jgi:spore germination cell wall hydrolase CwlJ-like protein
VAEPVVVAAFVPEVVLTFTWIGVLPVTGIGVLYENIVDVVGKQFEFVVESKHLAHAKEALQAPVGTENQSVSDPLTSLIHLISK